MGMGEEMDMKKLTVILLILMALLSGCAKESTYQPTGVENVTMSLSDVTPTGATVVILDDNREPFVYGEWFVDSQHIGANRICRPGGINFTGSHVFDIIFVFYIVVFGGRVVW